MLEEMIKVQQVAVGGLTPSPILQDSLDMTTSGKKNTVALLGASGHLGAETLKSLVVAADEGKIILIVLHRRTSDTSNVPPGIEKRILDANNAEFPEVEAALKGIDVLV